MTFVKIWPLVCPVRILVRRKCKKVVFAKWNISELRVMITLGYLNDSNAVEHSVDSDILYAVIYSSPLQDLYINLYFSK